MQSKRKKRSSSKSSTETVEAPPDFVRLGILSRPHGIRGAIRCSCGEGGGQTLRSVEKAILRDRDGRFSEKRIESRTEYRSGWLIKFAGIDNPEDAAALSGSELGLKHEALPPAGEDEIYWHSLQGMRVYAADGRLIGPIVGLIETGAADLIEVAGERGPIMIPFTDGFVTEVDEKSGRITVDLPPGLEDAQF